MTVEISYSPMSSHNRRNVIYFYRKPRCSPRPLFTDSNDVTFQTYIRIPKLIFLFNKTETQPKCAKLSLLLTLVNSFQHMRVVNAPVVDTAICDTYTKLLPGHYICLGGVQDLNRHFCRVSIVLYNKCPNTGYKSPLKRGC